MIIHCFSCGKRISDKMRVCPHCDTALSGLTSEEKAELERRRLRRRIYRARTATQTAMAVVMVGLLWWWMGGDPLMLDMPAPTLPVFLGAFGLVGYLAGWIWLVYLRQEYRRRR